MNEVFEIVHIYETYDEWEDSTVEKKAIVGYAFSEEEANDYVRAWNKPRVIASFSKPFDEDESYDGGYYPPFNNVAFHGGKIEARKQTLSKITMGKSPFESSLPAGTNAEPFCINSRRSWKNSTYYTDEKPCVFSVARVLFTHSLGYKGKSLKPYLVMPFEATFDTEEDAVAYAAKCKWEIGPFYKLNKTGEVYAVCMDVQVFYSDSPIKTKPFDENAIVKEVAAFLDAEPCYIAVVDEKGNPTCLYDDSSKCDSMIEKMKTITCSMEEAFHLVTNGARVNSLHPMRSQNSKRKASGYPTRFAFVKTVDGKLAIFDDKETATHFHARNGGILEECYGDKFGFLKRGGVPLNPKV